MGCLLLFLKSSYGVQSHREQEQFAFVDLLIFSAKGNYSFFLSCTKSNSRNNRNSPCSSSGCGFHRWNLQSGYRVLCIVCIVLCATSWVCMCQIFMTHIKILCLKHVIIKTSDLVRFRILKMQDFHGKMNINSKIYIVFWILVGGHTSRAVSFCRFSKIFFNRWLLAITAFQDHKMEELDAFSTHDNRKEHMINRGQSSKAVTNCTFGKILFRLSLFLHSDFNSARKNTMNMKKGCCNRFMWFCSSRIKFWIRNDKIGVHTSKALTICTFPTILCNLWVFLYCDLNSARKNSMNRNRGRCNRYMWFSN